MECAAILDVIRMRRLANPGRIDEARPLIVRSIQMLTRLVMRREPDR